MKFRSEIIENMKKLFLVLSVFVLAISLYTSAEEPLIKRPNPPTLVTDMADMLSPNDEAQLERKLVDYFANTSTQIAIVTVTDLQGYPISDFAFRLGQDWGIGSEKFDNGIVLLLKPKTSDGKGEAFIAVGYGLEGVVPDATAKQIVENEMIPSFKAGDMYGGVVNATNVLIDITKGEYNYQQYAKKAGGGFSPFLILIILFVVLPMIFRGKRGGVYSAGSRNSSLPFWIGMGLLSGAGNKHSGLFGDFNSGSGSFGGGSSFGSFGGFGGGGFGGGGAGGSW
jgi:uncharacterized protein